MSDEVESMAYFGEVPWHGKGTEVLSAMTAEEAIAAAGLDWEVKLQPVRIVGGAVIPNYSAIQRVNDGSVFGVVGRYYTPIQNKNAFQFFDEVVGTGEAKYHTAGSLRGGAKVWILAKVDGNFEAAKGDEVEKYLTLVNSHDGNWALQMFWSPVRVVCMNTLRFAQESQIGASFYSRHTKNIADRVEKAKELLGLATKWYEEFEEQAKWLATHQLPAAQMPKLLYAAFNQPESIKMEDVYSPIKVQMEQVKELVTVGRGNDNPAIQGTRWQAYNAVTEFVDYGRASRVDRLDAIWFGSGAKIKERAFKYLLKA